MKTNANTDAMPVSLVSSILAPCGDENAVGVSESCQREGLVRTKMEREIKCTES